MDELSGRTAVVTGAASGMGLAFARRFGQAGMHVVLADVEEPALDAAAGDLLGEGIDALGVPTDVSDPAALDALRDAAIDAFGQVHVVCNNAGVASVPSLGEHQIDLPEWEWVMGVNFWGVVNGHRAFLPHLMEHDEGHIVNTASMAGHFPGHGSYTASKWAVVAITLGLYHSLAQSGSNVGVSCLCPGWVDTNILKADRNRPEWAAPRPLEDVEVDAAIVARTAWVEDQLRSGMPPAEVADLVHDAVIGRRFWIFTDTTMLDRLDDQHASIRENRNPMPFPRLD
jgi:NAD(P)-dependent dehydrogenase (short-subunit alcohol dehydrogenase family)